MSKAHHKHPLEAWISFLLGMMLCVGPLLFGGVYPSGFLFLSSVSALCLVLWCIILLRNSRYRLLWPPVCWLVLVFLSYGLWRYRFSDSLILAEDEVLRLLLLASAFFLSVNFLYRQDTLQVLVLFLIFMAALLASYGIFQVLTHSDAVWHLTKPSQYGNRATGTYFCPNHLAGFLEMVLPLGLAYLFAGRLNATFKVFLGYACLVISVGIGLTLSRGGVLATGVSVLVFLFWLLGHRKYRVQALVALVGMIALSYFAVAQSSFLKDRIHQAFQRESSHDLNVRPLVWKAGINMWKDQPVFGVGPGQFDALFSLYRPRQVQERPGWMHNDYLQLLVEYGLVGSTVFVLGGLFLVLGAWKTRRYVLREGKDLGDQRHSNRAATVMGSSISLIAIGVHSVVDFNLYVPANGLLAVCLAGILVSHLRFTTESYWWRSSWFHRCLVLLLCVGMIGTLLNFLPSRWASDYWENQAGSHAKGSEQWVEHMARAASSKPERYDLPYEVGETLLQRGRQFAPGYERELEKSIRWFEQSIEAWPSYAFAYLLKGHALDSLGRMAEAESYYNMAASLEPQSSFVWAYWGLHEIEKGDLEEAHVKFEKSWEIRWYGNHLARDYLRILKQRLGLPPLTNPETGEIIH